MKGNRGGQPLTGRAGTRGAVSARSRVAEKGWAVEPYGSQPVGGGRQRCVGPDLRGRPQSRASALLPPSPVQPEAPRVQLIVDLARLHTVVRGDTEVGTAERLAAAAAEGQLSPTWPRRWSEGLRLLTGQG
jgi:hypothetical protein